MPNYVKNPTWADGAGGATPITAAKLNNVESGIFDAHYQAAARVFHNANQSINNTTSTILAFNSERFDTESNASSTIHDNVTNNSRLTCRTAGIYQITANIDWAYDNDGWRETRLKLNGATYIARSSITANIVSGTPVQTQTTTTLYSLVVNDYVEVEVWHNAGAALNVQTDSNVSPEFMMVRVA